MKKALPFGAADYLDSEEVVAEILKALAPGAKPRSDTVLRLLRALGVEMHMSPVVREA